MRRANFLQLLICLTFLIDIKLSRATSVSRVNAQTVRYFVCPSDEQKCSSCYYSEDNSFNLQCSVRPLEDPFDIFNVNFINKADDSSLSIDCPSTQLNISYYEYLIKGPETATISTIKINNCPKPQQGFKSFFDQWTISEGISELSLHFQPEPVTLEEDNLRGLWNVRKLNLIQNGLENLPLSLFEDLTNLTELRLNDNKLAAISESHFKNLKSLQSLQLGSNEIANIEADSFSDLGMLRRLNIEQNLLQEFPRGLFHALKSLTILDLSRNRITSLHEDQFMTNSQLKVLYINENNLTNLPVGIFTNNLFLKVLQLHSNPNLSVLPKGVFQNLGSLDQLDLSGCTISDLDEEIFLALTKLSSLNLSSNKLGRIHPSWFVNLSKLKSLDLSNNQLTVLEADVFLGLSNLETLKMDKNQLVELTAGVFQGLTTLNVLSIQDNRLSLVDEESVKPLANLEEIFLDGNLLTFQERPLSPLDGWQQSPFVHNLNLRTISLSRNKISELFFDWMNVFLNLSKLNLSDNNFERIVLNELVGFGSSTSFELDLASNKIRTVHLGLESGLNFDVAASNEYGRKHQKILHINDNPINCDCEAYNFAKYVNRTLPNLAHSWQIEPSDIVCESPSSLAGISLVHVSPNEFVCPCREDYRPCDCKKRPFDKTVLFDCRARNMTDIPSRLPNIAGHRIHVDLSSNPLNFDLAVNASLGASKFVTQLNLSQCNLNYTNLEAPGWLRQQTRFPNLAVLDLSNNALTSVPKTVVSYWNASTNLSIYLSENPWHCDCYAQDFFEYVVSSYTRVRDFNQMICSEGSYFSKMTLDVLCPTSSYALMKQSFVICALVLVFLLGFLVTYRYRSSLRVWLYNRGFCLSFVAQQEEDDDERLYDAFISFSHMDEEFVIQELVPQLEDPAPGLPSYRLCLHYRDWLAGEWIPDQITRSVASSRRTIVVLSEHFLESLWGKLEFRTAYEQVLRDKCMRLIIIVKGDLPPKSKMDTELQKYLSLNTYLNWNDPWFWDRLRYALPHKKADQVPGSRISQAIRDYAVPVSKTDGSKPKHLPPLPLLTNRESLSKHVTLPRDIELALTPLSTTSSTAPVFPAK